MEPIKIIPPKGFEIDLDKSDYSKGEIQLKEIEKVEKLISSYKDVCSEIIFDKLTFYTNAGGEIKQLDNCVVSHNDPNISLTKEQLESILNLNKLCNVAKYLNDGWLPDWEDRIYKYHLCIYENRVTTGSCCNYNRGGVHFKSRELAEQAISILGEETIKSALTLNH